MFFDILLYLASLKLSRVGWLGGWLGVLAGWLENLILMKTQLLAQTWTFDFDLGFFNLSLKWKCITLMKDYHCNENKSLCWNFLMWWQLFTLLNNFHCDGNLSSRWKSISTFRFILNLWGLCWVIFWLAHYCVSILTKFRVLLVLLGLNWALYCLSSDNKFSVFWVFWGFIPLFWGWNKDRKLFWGLLI